MSLPNILKTIPHKVPYISPEQSTHRLGKGFNVGLAWSGNTSQREERHISLEELQPLLNVTGINFVGLQKDQTVTSFQNFGPLLNDFNDTAALIDQLDLVISIDTAVVHVAGAMRKPVWVLLPFHPDWRWQLNRTDSSWYPSARLFRQSTMDDWSSVVQEVTQKLSSLVVDWPTHLASLSRLV